MSTPWATVAAQWNSDTLYKRHIDPDAAATLLGVAGNDNEREARVTEMIADMVDQYRQKVIQKAQNGYANTIKAFLALEAEKLREGRALIDNLRKASGEKFPDSAELGSIGDGERYFMATSTPDSTTFANVAENGEWLIVTDTSPNVNGLYINRGTLATPTWQKWDASALIDYIYNPEELLRAGYRRILFCIKNYGLIMDKGDFEERLQTMPKIIQMSYQEVKEAEDLAFDILRFDTSGDGVLSEAESVTNESDQYVF